MPRGESQPCKYQREDNPADEAAETVGAEGFAGPAPDGGGDVIGGGAEMGVTVSEVVGERGEVTSGDVAEGGGGGVEVVLGSFGGAVHGDAEEAGVEALTGVEDEGLALLDGELAEGADESSVGRVGVCCEEVVFCRGFVCGGATGGEDGVVEEPAFGSGGVAPAREHGGGAEHDKADDAVGDVDASGKAAGDAEDGGVDGGEEGFDGGAVEFLGAGEEGRGDFHGDVIVVARANENPRVGRAGGLCKSTKYALPFGQAAKRDQVASDDAWATGFSSTLSPVLTDSK